MILLALSVLTLATWQLAGQVAGVGGGGVNGTGALLSIQRQRLMSVLVGQGVATLAVGLYALLIGPLVRHEGVGGVPVRGAHRGDGGGLPGYALTQRGCSTGLAE